MLPTIRNNIYNNVNKINAPIINSYSSLVQYRNMSKKPGGCYTNEQIEYKVKLMKDTDFNSVETREDLLKQAINFRDSLIRKDIVKIQECYKQLHMNTTAFGHRSHLFSEVFISVFNTDTKGFKLVKELSCKELSSLIKTKNESTINVVLPANASIPDANSWKNSYEVVDAKKHASQKNLGENFKVVLSFDKPESEFYQQQIKNSNKVGDSPQQSSDAAYLYYGDNLSTPTRVDKDYKRGQLKNNVSLEPQSHQVSSVGNVSKSEIHKHYDINCNKHLNLIELKRQHGNLSPEEFRYLAKAEGHIKNFYIDKQETHLNELDKMGYPFRQFLNNDEVIT